MQENFATILETVADVRADRTAVSCGGVSLTWRQLEQRAARLAAFLADRGVGADDRVAIALYNGPEYLECVFATLKLRAIPVNVNYRYQPDEMLHLFEDAQVTAVIFDAALGQRVTSAAGRAVSVRTLVQVGDAVAHDAVAGDAVAGDTGAGMAAHGYEDVIAAHPPLPAVQRAVDHWLMYTGGTTGKPKGEPVPDSLGELRAATGRLTGAHGDALVCLPAPPLMHATGMYTTLGALVASGRVVFLPSRSYDADE